MGSAGSGQPIISGDPGCRWRTARYHDEECSMFFDCPSHLVERAPSDDDGQGVMDLEGDEAAPRASAPIAATTAAGAPISTDLERREAPEASSSRAPARAKRARPLSDSPHAAEDGRLAAEGTSSSSRAPPAILVVGEPRSEPAPVRPRLQTSPSTHPLGDPPTDSSSHTALSSLLAARRPQATTPRELPAAPPPPPPPPHSPGRQRLSVGHLSPAGAAGPSQPQPGAGGPEITLPRWQPDAEVTYCPICNTQFSIFVRKHHCR